ncbi:MAG: alpha/beta hydrolase [Anaerolineaceae bacterium]|nr:alpha/beta hydrolase [Anaerolineaceae bacterium]
MANLLTKFILFFLRTQLSGWSEGTITEQRARQERSSRFFKLPKQIRTRVIEINGIASEWIDSPDSDSGTILYLHGGAYALGSTNSHRELIARLVISTNCKALAINYRLAPENPFPAALEDALNAYHWLLSEGIDPSRICIAGDSAGGGLAIATLLALREKDMPLLAGVLCFSPWFDLTLSGDSVYKNENLDPILSSSILETYVNYYIGSNKASEPMISPLFGDLRGLPPIHIQSGRNEILLDDSVRFSEKAQQAGVDVTLKIWDDMFHVFQLFDFLPETKESMKEVTAFVSRVIKT